MKSIREILRLVQESSLSIRQIAKSCSCSPTTVTTIIERYKNADIPYPTIKDMDDAELEAKLYPQEINSSKRPLPDMDYIHRELKKKGVTLQLLWNEYKDAYPDGLMYSQFCDHYLRWRKLRNISMHQIHRAGEKTFVDWAGATMHVTDPKTGEIKEAYVFIGVLGASDYTYCEASLSQDLEHWINIHNNMFEYFKGVTEIVVPDNLKTGIKTPNYYEPDINPTYLEMASHYGTVIIPARIRKPKDKPLAENAVLIIERWIIAKFRNQTFFSIHDLNNAIWDELDKLNSKPFQKMEGSRKILYETIDKPALKPLPSVPFEYALWKHARVNIDYHVEFEGNFYSVPYQLIHQKVDIRATLRTVEILHQGKRIAAHIRELIANKRIYVTLPEHMPERHKKFIEWSPERIIKWAATIGKNTSLLVEAIMKSKEHPEQGYRACMGIMRLTGKYTPERVEKASQRALACRAISYKSVASILEKGLDQIPYENTQSQSPVMHGNIRGIGYYSKEVN